VEKFRENFKFTSFQNNRHRKYRTSHISLMHQTLKVYKIPLRVKVALCAVLVISNDPHPIYNKSNTNPNICKVRVRENTY